MCGAVVMVGVWRGKKSRPVFKWAGDLIRRRVLSWETGNQGCGLFYFYSYHKPQIAQLQIPAKKEAEHRLWLVGLVTGKSDVL
jgi:hypothetical protein